MARLIAWMSEDEAHEAEWQDVDGVICCADALRFRNKRISPMAYQPINLAEKFGRFSERWQPKIIAEMNDYQFKVVKIEGDFVWHKHDDTDETFLVIDGELRIDFRDGAVRINAGEMFVVPKGVEHKPFAAREVKLMLIEPRGVVNTGDGAAGERTAANDVWV